MTYNSNFVQVERAEPVGAAAGLHAPNVET